MIKTKKNENFQGFFNVFAFGELVAQIQGRLQANAFARQLAEKHEHTHYMNHRKELVEVS